MSRLRHQTLGSVGSSWDRCLSRAAPARRRRRFRVFAKKRVKNLGLRVRTRYARWFSPGTRDKVRVTRLDIPRRTRWIFLSPNPREPACLPSDATMTPRALLRNDRRVVSSVLIATLRGASGRTNPERPVPFRRAGRRHASAAAGNAGTALLTPYMRVVL